MERREFAKKAALGVVGAGVLAACGEGPGHVRRSAGVQTRPRVTWRLASSYPRTVDTIYGAAELLGRRVSELTEGFFSIRPYPAGELVPALQVMDAVQQGTIQVGQSASYYYIGKHPALALDCTVPFGLTVRAHNAWMLYGGGIERMRELFSDFNIINFTAGNTGVQMGGWFRNPLNSVRDLNGLKMRIPGQGGEVLARLGVSVQGLAGGDIYPALERGVIDATEWVGPYDDEKLGFYEIAKNYYYPGWWEPGPAITLYVNKTAWEQLPKSYQEAFETAAGETGWRMAAHYDALNPAALTRLLDKGVQLRPFPRDVMEAAMRESLAMQEETAVQNPAFRKIFEEWKKFRGESFTWFSTADKTYEDMAFPRFATRT